MRLRKIEAIVKPPTLRVLIAGLTAAGLEEIFVSEVWGIGRHRGRTMYYRGDVQTIDAFAKLRLEVVVPDERVDEVVSLLCRLGRTRGPGNGKVFVLGVLED